MRQSYKERWTDFVIGACMAIAFIIVGVIVLLLGGIAGKIVLIGYKIIFN